MRLSCTARKPVQIKEQIVPPVAQFDKETLVAMRDLDGEWTYYDVHPRRGAEALDAIGILPDFGERRFRLLCRTSVTNDLIGLFRARAHCIKKRGPKPPRLRGPLSEHPGRRLCRQSLIRISCPCRKETRAAEKDQAQELTRTAGSAPPGSPGFHVRLRVPFDNAWPNGTFA